MQKKIFKSGRLSLRRLDPNTEKYKSTSLSGLTEDASTETIFEIKDAVDQLFTIPSESISATYTYEFL